MRRLLRLRSFWCGSVVLLLLGGLWVGSLVYPWRLNFSNSREVRHLMSHGGTLEYYRSVSNFSGLSWRTDVLGPMTGTATVPVPIFPKPQWSGWREKELVVPAGGFEFGATSPEAWKKFLGAQEWSVRLPYWLAILAWLALWIPVILWRWRARREKG